MAARKPGCSKVGRHPSNRTWSLAIGIPEGVINRPYSCNSSRPSTLPARPSPKFLDTSHPLASLHDPSDPYSCCFCSSRLHENLCLGLARQHGSAAR